MGVSTDGILFYGIAYGEDGEHFEISELAESNGLDENDFEFEDLYALKVGVDRPKEAFSKASEPLYHQYWDKKREVNQQSGCEVGTYCSDGSPMYYVCIRDSEYTANRGYATEIPDGLTAKPEWKDKLKEYCGLMGLPYMEPAWLLVSYWG